MIQTIRRFLSILRLLHIPFATQLDAALADVQNRIKQQIAFVRQIFNEIINTLAIVLDPTLLVTRNVLGGSLLRNLGAVKRIVGYGSNRALTPNEQATIDKDHSRYFKSVTDAHATVLLTSGPTNEDNQMRADFRKEFEAVLNAPMPTWWSPPTGFQ
jgi:hypothetical protein